MLAGVLAVAYLLLPRMGSDLSAQVARATFFAAHGYTPIDLRWYGGVDQLGYSLVSQPVMAVLTAPVTGALALFLAAVAGTILLRRTGAARPELAGALLTVCLAGNLVSGRVTYGLAVLFGLLALLTLTHPAWRWASAVLALIASATSPVAGLFLGLAGVALLVSRRYGAGLLVAVPAAIALAMVAGLFGDGGWMNISRTDAVRAIGTSLAVAVLVPRWPVRVGGLLSAAGVLLAALVHTPVGLNATRLAVMFALPVLAGYAVLPRLSRMPWWALVPLLAAAVWWQPPVVVGDVRDIGNPTADPAYFAPLRERLAALPMSGRLEIPPTRDYWESARMGDVPLARGWLRQADIDRNPLFFAEVPGASGTGAALTPATYRAWLAEKSVQYVAVPDTELSWVGRDEAALVGSGLPYLTEIWSGAHWRLYSVRDVQPIVAPPASLVAQDAASLTLNAPDAADIVVRVRYYPWLRADGGALVEQSGRWTLLRVPAPGRYTLSSAVAVG
ncbi:hypothetical protein GCM10012284_22510 [Mangrovihabitans endophyticus]|uniref:Uncharacterized protein n=1 Tax=Mangrovihabitans endophyticus TaxID=1751298 RepID=A0A8J3BXG9_9ACTN|nr:hypothetical protein GCM10012284_22510 [Mangrovihabitans endophyticus]